MSLAMPTKANTRTPFDYMSPFQARTVSFKKKTKRVITRNQNSFITKEGIQAVLQF
jgi:hypothetical protein